MKKTNNMFFAAVFDLIDAAVKTSRVRVSSTRSEPVSCPPGHPRTRIGRPGEVFLRALCSIAERRLLKVD